MSTRELLAVVIVMLGLQLVQSCITSDGVEINAERVINQQEYTREVLRQINSRLFQICLTQNSDLGELCE